MSESEDHREIVAVSNRYATGIDRRDWALFGTVFTRDCAGHTPHRHTDQVVAIDGDRAAARTDVDAVIMAVDGKSGVNAIGWSDDEIVRTEAGWRIARRRFTTARTAVLSEK